jgi:hypothetical protein
MDENLWLSGNRENDLTKILRMTRSVSMLTLAVEAMVNGASENHLGSLGSMGEDDPVLLRVARAVPEHFSGEDLRLARVSFAHLQSGLLGDYLRRNYYRCVTIQQGHFIRYCRHMALSKGNEALGFDPHLLA